MGLYSRAASFANPSAAAFLLGSFLAGGAISAQPPGGLVLPSLRKKLQDPVIGEPLIKVRGCCAAAPVLLGVSVLRSASRESCPDAGRRQRAAAGSVLFAGALLCKRRSTTTRRAPIIRHTHS